MDDNNELNSFFNINEKGADTIVFHLGSHSIKFGLASQFQPFVINNCIAYKLKEPSKITYSEESNTLQLNEVFLTNLNNMEQESMKKMVKLEGKNKKKINLVNAKSHQTNKVCCCLFYQGLR